MSFLHPEALDDVGGHPPDSVSLGGTTYSVGGDGLVDCSGGEARVLADAHGVDVADITVEETVREISSEASESDGGICGTEMSDGTICERDADDCPYH